MMDESLTPGTVEHAVDAVLRGLAEYDLDGAAPKQRGMLNVRAFAVAAISGVSVDLANYATDVLEQNGWARVIRGIGTAPYRFMEIQLTAAGRAEAQRRERRQDVDARKVFVIYGRDSAASGGMFEFLRSIDLDPYEFRTVLALTGEASPHVGDAVEAGILTARAAVALFTGDDLAQLRPELLKPGEPPEAAAPQPRPNVLLETGMAMALYKARVVLVRVGELRAAPSDLAGRHWVEVAKGRDWRHDLADRLRLAGCDVKTEGRDHWRTAGAGLEESGSKAVDEEEARLRQRYPSMFKK